MPKTGIISPRDALLPKPRQIEVVREDEAAWRGRTPGSNELLTVYSKQDWIFTESKSD